MVELLAIAPRVLAGLIIFGLGLYLVYVAFSFISKSDTQKSRSLGQALLFVIIGLFAAIALEQIKNPGNIFHLNSSNPAQLVAAQEYRRNVTLGGTNVAVGGGGYVTGIYLHPLQQDLIYIKTDVGGFYRWNPNEQSWVPLTDQFSMEKSRYYGGESLALDPKNPNIVYIAAGDHLRHKPGTIFKSIDRGRTWTKLNLDLPMGGNENKRWVGERLAVSPFNSNLILFGSRQDGLWKSTDAGATWSKVTSFPDQLREKIGIPAILFDKNVPNLVYANAYGDGIYRSTDNGVTWSKIPESPTTANRMAIGSNGTLYVTSSKSLGVSKYVNGVWRDITPNGAKGAFNGLNINPANPNEILVSLGEKPYTKIYHSLDGGATWTEKKRSSNNKVPWWNGIMLRQPWTAAIEFDPKVAGRVWLTDWYGVWRTEDIKANPVVWTNYVQGHEETVVFTLVSPPRGSLLLSGMADVDGFNHNNGLDAYPSKEFGGSGPSFQDTYSIAYCETNPLRMVRVGGNRWNSTYTGATSTDGGLTWQKFPSFPTNKMAMRVAMSATNPNLFVVSISKDRPLRTTDGGASWESVSGLPNGPSGPWNWSQSLAADTVDGKRFYYYSRGRVYRSTDGGASFEIVNSSLPTESWHSLKPMPGVKNEIWLSLDDKGLYRSTDGGNDFSRIAGVERAYLFAFGKPPQESRIPALYVYGKIDGQGEGIFRSLDRGKTWTSIGDRTKPIGKNPKAMEASKQVFGLVFVGTGGRGIYYGTS